MTIKDLEGAYSTLTRDGYIYLFKEGFDYQAKVKILPNGKVRLEDKMTYDTIKELQEGIEEHISKLPFSSNTYCPLIRHGVNLQKQAEEYLRRLGFVEWRSHNVYGIRNVFALRFNIYDNVSTLSIYLEEKDDKVNLGVLSQTYLIASPWYDTIEQCVRYIDEVISSVYLLAMPVFLKMMDTIQLTGFSNIDIKKVDKSFNVHNIDIKQMLIPKLEEALKILKEE